MIQQLPSLVYAPKNGRQDSTRDLHTPVQSNIIHKSQKMEETPQVSINKRMDKQNVV